MLSKFTFLFVIATVWFSGQAVAQHKRAYILLSGKIKNVDPGPNGEKTVELALPFGVSGQSKTIRLASDGSFSDTIDHADGEYTLIDGKNPVPLYLRTGKKYVINYDADNFRNGFTELLGDDVQINSYFINKQQQKVFIDHFNTKQSENEFRKIIITVRTQALNRLQKAKLPDAIKAREAKSIQYEYLADLYFFLSLKEGADSTYVPLTASREELTIDYLNEKEYRQYYYYQKLVYEYYGKKLRYVAQEKKKKYPSYSLKQNELALLSLLVSNKYIKDYIISLMVISGLKNAKDVDSYYQSFTNYYTGADSDLKLQAADIYMRLSKLKVGQPSPEFVNYTNYNGGTTSLKDFRGKYIYIDLWATWCVNCWAQLPALKKLEQAYQGKNIVFVSISLDKDARKWVSTVKGNVMSGVQLLANQVDASFRKEYAVYGIPRYIFLDTNGAIIAYSAPRPLETEALNALFRKAGL